MPETPYPIDQPIAAGRTAEIFAWGEGRALKLTRPGFPPILADQEWTNASAAWQLGARAPKPFELIEVDGRRGVVFKRIQGPNLVQYLGSNLLRVVPSAKILAQQHAALHALPAPGFPTLPERIRCNLANSPYLDAARKQRLLDLFETLPDGDRLVHADFHPENILLTPDGPIIIDWEGAMCGSPSGDVANTRLWIRSAITYDAAANAKSRLGGWLVRQTGLIFERVYLKEYNRLALAPAADQAAWLAIVAALHLGDDSRRDAQCLEPMVAAGLA